MDPFSGADAKLILRMLLYVLLQEGQQPALECVQVGDGFRRFSLGFPKMPEIDADLLGFLLGHGRNPRNELRQPAGSLPVDVSQAVPRHVFPHIVFLLFGALFPALLFVAQGRLDGVGGKMFERSRMNGQQANRSQGDLRPRQAEDIPDRVSGPGCPGPAEGEIQGKGMVIDLDQSDRTGQIQGGLVADLHTPEHLVVEAEESPGLKPIGVKPVAEPRFPGEQGGVGVPVYGNTAEADRLQPS